MEADNHGGLYEHKEPLTDFLLALYIEGGYPSWQQFAREAGVLPSSLSDWKTGKNSPSGPNLLNLIQTTERRKAGALETAAARSDGVTSFMQAHHARLEELAEQRGRDLQRFQLELEDQLERRAKALLLAIRSLAKEVRELKQQLEPQAGKAKGGRS